MPRWLLVVALVLSTSAAVASSIIAVDQQQQIEQRQRLEPVSTAPAHTETVSTVNAELRTLRAQLRSATRSLGSDRPIGHLTGVQLDVRDLHDVLAQLTERVNGLQSVVNDMLAICRGQRPLYTTAGMAAPACPDGMP